MDYDQLYKDIRKIVYSKRHNILKEVNRIISGSVSKDDLIQELIIAYWEKPPKGNLFNFCYNTLRRWRRRAEKMPTTLSIDTMYDNPYNIPDTDNNLNIVSGEAEAPLFNFPDYDLIETFGVLEDLDMAVLRGHMTRHDAAEILGVSYSTYQQNIYRKMKKVAEMLSDFS